MVMRLKNFQVAKKLATCEADLEKAEDRAEVMTVVNFKRGGLPSNTITHHPPQVGETKILELEEELRVVANNLKSLEVMMMMTPPVMMAMLMMTMMATKRS